MRVDGAIAELSGVLLRVDRVAFASVASLCGVRREAVLQRAQS